MAVFRINKTRDYTVMSNWHLKDRGLSLKAKGLLSIMLSLPDDWDYSISGLCAICIENESAVKSALKELKACGYLRIDKIMPDKTTTGRIEYEYNIFEQPHGNQAAEIQGVENLPLEIQGVENPVQLSTKKSSTKESSTKRSNTEDKKVSKKAPLKSFDELIDGYTENEELRSALRDYIQMRTAIRKKITNRGLELAFKELDKLARTNAETVAIVNQSVMNSWQGLFPLKGNQQGTRNNGTWDDRYYKPSESTEPRSEFNFDFE